MQLIGLAVVHTLRLLVPLAAESQQTVQIPRIGVLGSGPLRPGLLPSKSSRVFQLSQGESHREA
jgi:hypothetical protein